MFIKRRLFNFYSKIFSKEEFRILASNKFDLNIYERNSTYTKKTENLNNIFAQFGRFSRELIISEFERRYEVSTKTKTKIVDRKKPIQTGHHNNSILMATLPKTASSHIWKTLSKIYCLERLEIDEGPFPLSHLNFRNLLNINEGNFIASAHFPISDVNKHFLEQTNLKVVVHTRHPCDIIVSMTHYINRYADDLYSFDSRYNLDRFYPKIPDEYFSWPLNKQIDFQITTFTPQIIQWIQGWKNYSENSAGHNRLLFTSYEAFHDDEKKYFQTLCEFFGLDRDILENYDFSRNKKSLSNYRQGKKLGYKEHLTDGQIFKAISQIPEDLLEFFDWKT